MSAMEDQDKPLDPSQVEKITSLETARMTLRWALERMSSLEKSRAEQEKRAEAEISLRQKADSENETLKREQRELYYKKLEEFIALHLAGKLGTPPPAPAAKPAEKEERDPREADLAARERALDRRRQELEHYFAESASALKASQSKLRACVESEAQACAQSAEAAVYDAYAARMAALGRLEEPLLALSEQLKTGAARAPALQPLIEEIASRLKTVCKEQPPRPKEVADRAFQSERRAALLAEAHRKLAIAELAAREAQESAAAEHERRAEAERELARRSDDLATSLEAMRLEVVNERQRRRWAQEEAARLAALAASQEPNQRLKEAEDAASAARDEASVLRRQIEEHVRTLEQRRKQELERAQAEQTLSRAHIEQAAIERERASAEQSDAAAREREQKLAGEVERLSAALACSQETAAAAQDRAAASAAEASRAREALKEGSAALRALEDEFAAFRAAPPSATESSIEARAHLLEQQERELASRFAAKKAELESLKRQLSDEIDRWLSGKEDR